MNILDAISLFQGEMSRELWRPTSQKSYARGLTRFAEHIGTELDIESVSVVHARSWLDEFRNHAPATAGIQFTYLSSFFRFLLRNDLIEMNPMTKIKRPKTPPLKDRPRVRITQQQFEEIQAECRSWPEMLAVHSFAMLGLRRTALAEARWRDLDAKQWVLRVLEKGNKLRDLLVPTQLQAVYLAYAFHRDRIGDPIHPDEWIVPNKRKLNQLEKRSPRIAYVLVTDVAKRCGFHAHCHTLRAGFALRLIEKHPDRLEMVRQCLGHESMNTTLGYVSEYEGQKAMADVVHIDFGGRRDPEPRLADAA